MTNDSSTTGRLALLGMLALGLAAGPVLAQETPEQRDACMHDTKRLCENAMPDIGRAVECLKAHRSSLNHRCRKALDTPAAAAPAPAAAAPAPAPATATAGPDKPASPPQPGASPAPAPQASSDKPAELPSAAAQAPASRPHLAFAPHWRYTLRKPQVPIVRHRTMTAAQRALAARRALARTCKAAGRAYNPYSGTCSYGLFGGFLQ